MPTPGRTYTTACLVVVTGQDYDLTYPNYVNKDYLNKDWRCVEHETSFLVQINYCDWFAWCMVTAVALLLLLNDKCKPESLQRDGRPGWIFPQTAGCKARTCFVVSNLIKTSVYSFVLTIKNAFHLIRTFDVAFNYTRVGQTCFIYGPHIVKPKLHRVAT